MIAAIYARKSTEQTGVADEQKSVARQIEHATLYGVKHGWTVADELVYVDDGISGAEFSNRPGFLRLMNALKPKPAFQVLIMSEESRLGREQIEVSYALKDRPGRRARVFLPRGSGAHTGQSARQDHVVADDFCRRARAREGSAAYL
jgi:DNA invertase Pin-like site-specific DNA recombinase